MLWKSRSRLVTFGYISMRPPLVVARQSPSSFPWAARRESFSFFSQRGLLDIVWSRRRPLPMHQRPLSDSTSPEVRLGKGRKTTPSHYCFAPCGRPVVKDDISNLTQTPFSAPVLLLFPSVLPGCSGRHLASGAFVQGEHGAFACAARVAPQQSDGCGRCG